MSDAKRMAVLAALSATLLLSSLGGALAASASTTIVAAPGAWLTQYATPAMATHPDLVLTFRNEDIMKHDVVSVEFGPDGQPWCLDAPAGYCPRFYTPLVGRGQTVRVQGAETLPPGVHEFFCSLHTAMRGALVVSPS